VQATSKKYIILRGEADDERQRYWPGGGNFFFGTPLAAMYTYYHVRKLRSEERLAAIARGFIAMMAPIGAGRAMTTVAARPPANPATNPFHTLGRFPRVNLTIISSEPSMLHHKKGRIGNK
jgi:hypothetical protein